MGGDASDDLAGRVAVITGAGRGIGRALALGLLAEGCRVCALDRAWGTSDDAEPDVGADLESRGAHVEAVDVTDVAAVRRAFDATIARFGTVDILVNNAAMRMRDINPARYTEVLATTEDDWRRMLDVNVIGPFRMIKAFAVPMRERGSGVIINISSSSGDRGMPGDNPYGASKAALTNLSQSLAAELAPSSIAVVVVNPWITRTTGYDEQNALHPIELPPDIGPVLRPDSVVPVVVWAAKQGMRVTGEVVSVREWLLEHGQGPLERWAANDPSSLSTARPS